MASGTYVSVKIDEQAYAKASAYSDATGIPIKSVIDEALTDWLEVVGAARLEAIEESKKRFTEMVLTGKTASVGSVL